MAFRHYLSIKHTIDNDELCYEGNNWRIDISDANKLFLTACSAGNINLIMDILQADKTHWEMLLQGTLHINQASRILNVDYGEWLNRLKVACLGGHLEIVKLILSRMHCTDSMTMSYILIQACSGGHLDLVKLCDKSLPYSTAVKYAFLGGHMDVIEYCLSISTGFLFWNMYLEYACVGGHMPAINYAMSSGSVNAGLRGACQNGNIEIVQLMISYGATEWGLGLDGACQGGHLEIAQDMISRGAVPSTYNFECACHSGNLDLVIYLGGNREMAFYHSCRAGHINIAEHYMGDLNAGVRACMNQMDCHPDMARRLIELGADNYTECMSYACAHSCVGLVKYLIDYPIIWDNMLNNAYKGGNVEIILLVMQYSGTKKDWPVRY